MSKTLHSCLKLGLVSLRILYTEDAFTTLWLRFHEFPGAIETTSADWAALDDALQLPIHDSLKGLTVGRWPLKVPAGETMVWSENYGYAVSEADPAVGEELKAMLPQTMKRETLRLSWVRLV